MSSFRFAREQVSVVPGSVRVGMPKEQEKKKTVPEKEVQSTSEQEVQETPVVKVVQQANEEEKKALAEKTQRLEEAMRLVNGLHEAAQSAKADAEKRAREIIAEAEARAQQMMIDAEAAIEQEMENAKQLGFAEGMAKAEEEALARKNFEAGELQQMINSIRVERERVIDSLEGEVIETVIEIAKKTVHTQIRDNEVFLCLVRSEMAELKSTENITVSVAVEDFVRVFGNADGVKEEFPDGNVKVVADKELSVGDCIIETDVEVVDCSVDGQLEKLEQLLRAEIEED